MGILALIAPIIVFFGVPVLLAPTVKEGAPSLADSPAQQELVIYGYYLVSIILLYVLAVICINRLRMAGKSGWWLLVPGYNLWLLFFEEDVAE